MLNLCNKQSRLRSTNFIVLNLINQVKLILQQLRAFLARNFVILHNKDVHLCSLLDKKDVQMCTV